ncbi:hypothetical protein AMTR_s00124p00049100 [Amborella trichopoda]|uniref:Uncharacterized protein n=1 Tax=Amborella trichopoda TaxID=13333 RepID=W1NNQ8_AMBTC|nr:hypothetical protein AMTR_s00124p00049100 [Amborella trichopoda]
MYRQPSQRQVAVPMFRQLSQYPGSHLGIKTVVSASRQPSQHPGNCLDIQEAILASKQSSRRPSSHPNERKSGKKEGERRRKRIKRRIGIQAFVPSSRQSSHHRVSHLSIQAAFSTFR